MNKSAKRKQQKDSPMGSPRGAGGGQSPGSAQLTESNTAGGNSATQPGVPTPLPGVGAPPGAGSAAHLATQPPPGIKYM